MIYTNRRGLLSRSLSGYVRASTDNPNGWRPQYTRLGAELFSQARFLPDWKTAAAAKQNAARRGALIAAGRHNMLAVNAAIVDARARGQRLSGLGAATIDPGAAMQPGQVYIFHFQALFGAPDPNSIAAAIAPDTNFSSIAAGAESGGGLFYSNFYVTFTYTGQGSTVLGAGSEMNSVISDAFRSGSFLFLSAQGPSAAAVQVPPASTPAGPAGSGLPYPNAPNAAPGGSPGGTPFNWDNFFAGLGTGGAAAAIAGGILLLVVLRD